MESGNKYESAKRKFLVLAGIMLMAVLLAGCGEGQRMEKAKALAEDYLSELKKQVLDETLYLMDTDAEQYGEMLAFAAYSEKYEDDFRIYVNSDNSISDSYFTVGLKEIAESTFTELVKRALPDEEINFSISINKNVSALSGKTFTSIKEANSALNNLIGLVNVVIAPVSTPEISDGNLDKILRAMQDEGLYGDLRMKNDVRVFHISDAEINYTRTDDPAGDVRYYDWEPDIND